MVKKCNVFYGQEPPVEKPTNAVRGVNYQLLAILLLNYWKLLAAVMDSSQL